MSDSTFEPSVLTGKYKNVIITFSDGREIIGTIPAFAEKENPDVRIVRVRFTEPRDFPEGVNWAN